MFFHDHLTAQNLHVIIEVGHAVQQGASLAYQH